jgi:hypothetical protein
MPVVIGLLVIACSVFLFALFSSAFTAQPHHYIVVVCLRFIGSFRCLSLVARHCHCLFGWLLFASVPSAVWSLLLLIVWFARFVCVIERVVSSVCYAPRRPVSSTVVSRPARQPESRVVNVSQPNTASGFVVRHCRHRSSFRHAVSRRCRRRLPGFRLLLVCLVWLVCWLLLAVCLFRWVCCLLPGRHRQVISSVVTGHRFTSLPIAHCLVIVVVVVVVCCCCCLLFMLL